MARTVRRDQVWLTSVMNACASYAAKTGRGIRRVAAAALLAWGVAAGMLAVQAQTVVPPSPTVATPGSPSVAEFYLRRGEDFSGVRDYDRAIADYNTAIQLKPDYAEAYNDRGFAYYLKGTRSARSPITPAQSHCGPTTRRCTTAAALCTCRMVTVGRKPLLTSIAPSR